MNNLKRVLSLALSGIMLVGMMAMGASAADFSDAEDIEHTEAVGILVALKVINGQDDGSFNPKGDVTRGQMAKMIAVAMMGGSDVNTGVKGTPTFTDISGHWAESYIEYCADLAIISGRGDGTFDPDGKVTGLEATKMVLTALGYDATAYKLTGPTWAVRTDELARQADPKLFSDLEGVAMATNASRDTAAQLIWNGLQNKTRKVTPSTNTSNGEVTWQYNPGDELLNERYGAKIETATFNGNYYTGDTTVKGEIDVGGADFPYDFDIAHIGEEVKVIWKDGKNGGTTKDALDSKDVIYGVFTTGASKVVNAKLADVKNNKNSKAQINVGGTKYDLDTTGVEVVVNFTGDTTAVADNILTTNGTRTYGPAAIVGVDDNLNTTADESDNSTLTKHLKKSTGDAIKLVLDDDKVTKIYVTTAKLAAITAVNSEKITLNNGVGTIKVADHDVEEGLKKGDVVTVSTFYKTSATADDAFVTVKKAETVEGEVKGWKDSETVTLDDTKYNVHNSAATFMLTGSAIPNETAISTFKDTADTYIGEDVRLFMVNGYVGAAIQISESANNYSLVTEVKSGITAGSVFGGLQLQVMDAEGVKTIITVSDDSTDNSTPADGKITDDDYKVGDIVTYTMNKDNEAEVSVVGALQQAKIGAYDDSTKAFGEKGQTLTVTSSDCVLFVQTKAGKGPEVADDNIIDGASFKAYKIRDLKSLEGDATKTGMTTVTKDGKVVAAFVNTATGKNPAGATSSTVYGIVSAVGGRVKDYFTYTVKSNGETYTVNSKDGSLKKGDLVYFDKTNDDNYADTNVAADQNKGKGDVHVVTYTVDSDTDLVWIKEADGKDTLTYYTSVSKDSNNNYVGATANQVTLAMDEDVAIVYVDVDNSDSAAESSIGAFDSVTGYANAVIITETQGSNQVIIAVFVETSNTADALKK